MSCDTSLAKSADFSAGTYHSILLDKADVCECRQTMCEASIWCTPATFRPLEVSITQAFHSRGLYKNDEHFIASNKLVPTSAYLLSQTPHELG